MLPNLRIAVTSPVTEHRALMGRVLASTRPDRGEGDAEAFAPAWSDCALPVTASRWVADDYDLLALDDEVWRCFGRHGRCELRIVDDGTDRELLAETALQIAVRFQRFDASTNPASATPFFQQILAAHEEKFDRRRPLAAAAHDHALDTWRWVLRLEPHASLSLQVAALFHEDERVATGADPRLEEALRPFVSILESLQTPKPLIERARSLIAEHRAGPSNEPVEPAVALLSNAAALSFFSLGAPAFASHFGPAHAARKVSAGLRRLDIEGHSWLARLKLTQTIRALVFDSIGEARGGPVLAASELSPGPEIVSFTAEPRP
jgi:hypothetical protein